MKSLKADRIKEEMQAINEHWFGVERTDIDLKYLIGTNEIIDFLKQYEIPSFDDESIFDYYENHYEEVCGDNTYNHLMLVQNDFNWTTFKVADDEYHTLVMFHRGGDIRGNYTDYMVLKFDNVDGFSEALYVDMTDDDTICRWFDLEVQGEIFHLCPQFDECLRVEYELDGDYIEIYRIWGNNDEEVIEQLKVELKKSLEENLKYLKMRNENADEILKYENKLKEIKEKFNLLSIGDKIEIWNFGRVEDEELLEWAESQNCDEFEITGVDYDSKTFFIKDCGFGIPFDSVDYVLKRKGN